MIPSATGPGAPRDARVVTGDEAFLGSEDGIEFWRGVDNAEAGTQAFLARARCAAGTRIPPHWHTEDTIAYLAEGKAVFRSGDDLADVHEMHPGDWLFVPAGMVHVEETPADSHGDFLYARAGAGGETTYLDDEPAAASDA
jgi:uncharacterized RmlC-like cupin family protein